MKSEYVNKTHANTLPHCFHFMCIIPCADWPVQANRQGVM